MYPAGPGAQVSTPHTLVVPVTEHPEGVQSVPAHRNIAFNCSGRTESYVAWKNVANTYRHDKPLRRAPFLRAWNSDNYSPHSVPYASTWSPSASSSAAAILPNAHKRWAGSGGNVEAARRRIIEDAAHYRTLSVQTITSERGCAGEKGGNLCGKRMQVHGRGVY